MLCFQTTNIFGTQISRYNSAVFKILVLLWRENKSPPFSTVYQYHTPPLRRLPPLIWVRIQDELDQYLITAGADGAQVVTWYHRQFRATARKRYMTDEVKWVLLYFVYTKCLSVAMQYRIISIYCEIWYHSNMSIIMHIKLLSWYAQLLSFHQGYGMETHFDIKCTGNRNSITVERNRCKLSTFSISWVSCTEISFAITAEVDAWLLK